MDKLSGKDFKRPAYRKMIRRLKPNDVLIVKSIDRLGRNYKEIMEQEVPTVAAQNECLSP